MQDFDGDHRYPFGNKWRVGDFIGDDSGYSWIFYLLKDVGKFHFDLFQNILGAVDGNVLFLGEIVGTDIIQASCMVFVLMGIKDGIQATDFFPEHLLPEIGTGIYDDAFSVNVKVDGCPESLIPKIQRTANWAIAAYHWDTLGSSCP